MISEIHAETVAAAGGGSKRIRIIANDRWHAAGGLAAAMGHCKSSSPSVVGTISTPPPTVLVPVTPAIQPH